MRSDIDDDIERFDTERQKALVNLLYTNGLILSQLNVIFKKYDLTRQQFNILRILQLHDPKAININTIKENMIEKMSDVSRIVERMNSKGLLRRTKKELDKREVRVNISPKGKGIIEDIYKQQNHFDEIITCLTPQEVEQLNKILTKIRKNL